MKKLILSGVATFLWFYAPSAGAAVVFSDSFNYSNGGLVSVSSGAWVHHSGGTTGELQVVSGRALLSETNAEDVSAPLQGQPYGASTNVSLYAAFTINVATPPSNDGLNHGANAYFAHFKDTGTANFRDKIFLFTNGVPAGFYRVGVGNVTNAPNSVISSNLSLNADYRLVTRYTPSNATSMLWINPSAETDPGASATDTATTIGVATFALRESTSGANGMGTLFLDNLVVGTTFADVVSNLPPAAPAITTQPQDETVNEGASATFTVVASGTAPLSYQWQFYSTNLPGATSSALSVNPVTTNDAGPYTVTVTNTLGTTNSQPATLTVNPPVVAPTITVEPDSQIVSETSNVTFSITAAGDLPLGYQWRFYGTNLPAATGASLTLSSVTTSQAGPYTVVVTNGGGSDTSSPAILTVNPLSQQSLPAISYVTYNMKGNGAADWSTNAPQVQAIGRELMYLNPDIITFNEIPNLFTYEMTNFITAFLPGYYLAINSATDGFIRNGIASRFPIISSKSYLHSSDLNPYGYTNSNFTRDLFEAQVTAPNFPQRLHVFVVHLKSGQDTDSSNKRTAEAGAVSNFFVTVFLATNTDSHPYILSGDMNEDINAPPASNPQSIQKLVNPATGLQLTTPVNPFTGSRLSFSIQSAGGLSKRYDYVMPCALMFSNITSSQVFRTDLLASPPPPLLGSDDSTGSDHLPVQMVFSNPYDKPFRVTSITRSNQNLTLQWQSIPGQPYRVEASSNLVNWTVFATNMTASAYSSMLSTNVSESFRFLRVYRVP